ncbi:hypothetical protein BD324DRAFT_648974 [Kockovaella imperatae]|uniref:Uncharacterized protein n=1 Tax=Kockovaella imperatae TaxID=4999 RepID=A0A1Y1UN04_9TREE|nr:hypothetical protein BD324DRAFT_648974 [Kockovaella imperatae]ORX38864.1 hypothetical protein BD324DRAFT_648974 [Kockovaella imperatae]
MLPVPAASPLFLALFYSILFLATSPSSPFVDSPIPPALSSLSSSAPLPDRTWLSVNSGRVQDPHLAGYQPTYPFNETDPGSLLTSNDDQDPRTIDDEIPPNHVDWRYRGIGLIVDFGWKRSDAGIRWERGSVGLRKDTKEDRSFGFLTRFSRLLRRGVSHGDQ